MHNTELIEFLKTQPFTRTQVYNLLTDDLEEACPELNLDNPSPLALKLIEFFQYKIEETLLPVIEQLKN